MFGIGSVRKPYEGASPYPSGLACRAEEAKQKSIETLGRQPTGVSPRGKARERRSSEISIQTFAGDLGRVKPKGASSGQCAKHTLGRQGLIGWVEAQELRLVKPALASSGAKVYGRAKQYVGSSGRKRSGYQP